jgi:hypothetical protein
MAMINKLNIFPNIVLSKIKDRAASQEKSLLSWKDRIRRYKGPQVQGTVEISLRVSLVNE